MKGVGFENNSGIVCISIAYMIHTVLLTILFPISTKTVGKEG